MLFQPNIKQTSDENKERYQLEDYQLIQYQILQNNIKRIIWQTVRIIANEILSDHGKISYIIKLINVESKE